MSYQKNGGLLGVHALIKHRAGGLDRALCFNGGSGGEEGGALPQVVEALENEFAKVERWPLADLFERPPYRPGS